MKLEEHPTVLHVRGRAVRPSPAGQIDATWLRELCLDCGADDVGFVEIDRPEVAEEKPHALRVLPGTRTLISFVCRMNRDTVRSVERSVANVEFHEAGHDVNEVARQIVRKLEDAGHRAANPPMAFPMEASQWPGRMWVISHKPIAVAAGLGMIGVHRNVIHPKFGNFILLGTVLLAADVTTVAKPIDYNPCLGCKLCVSVCPVGAIGTDGHFDFSACYHHNYHDFMANAAATAETFAKTGGRSTPRPEAVALWQSLGFGPNYQSGFCLAVCPAGEEVISPFLDDKKTFIEQTVRPLQETSETIYCVPGSDAEQHAAKRFPHKPRQSVTGTLVPRTLDGFLNGMRTTFQRNAAADLNATYHFSFIGSDERHITIVIRNKTLNVEDGHIGTADLKVVADTETWLGFLQKKRNIVWAIARRNVKVSGPIRLLRAFGRCFPT